MAYSKEHKEAELLGKLAEDLQGNFANLVDAYNPPLRAYAFSVVKCPYTVDEIMQECWIDIYQALYRYPKEKILALKLKSWLYQIVHNQTIDEINRKKKMQNWVPIEELGDDDLRENEERGPLAFLEFSDRVEEISNVIEHLSLNAQDRELLMLYLLKGWHCKEIACKQGRTIGAVRTSLSRSLKQLRAVLLAKIS